MYKADTWSTTNDRFKNEFKKMGMIAFRVSLVAIAFTAALKLHYTFQSLAIMGGIVSIPATLIGSGVYYLYKGVSSIYQNLFVNCVLKEVAKGLAHCVLGCLLLDLNDYKCVSDIYPGICDGAFSKMLWPISSEF